MIIISQDKTELINFDNIVRLSANVNANGLFLIEAHNFCDDFETVMGFYETEERAKEIIEDLKKAYQLGRLFECIKSVEVQEKMASDYAEDKKSPFVYQMPEK